MDNYIKDGGQGEIVQFLSWSFAAQIFAFGKLHWQVHRSISLL